MASSVELSYIMGGWRLRLFVFDHGRLVDVAELSSIADCRWLLRSNCLLSWAAGGCRLNCLQSWAADGLIAEIVFNQGRLTA